MYIHGLNTRNIYVGKEDPTHTAPLCSVAASQVLLICSFFENFAMLWGATDLALRVRIGLGYLGIWLPT